ncbi:MAG: hypothetical protein H7195_11270 [Chryseobacterium sp.]|nr:hypothetical protein [Chryseobacterium sp.]
MDNKELLKYLYFFSKNIVDLSNDNMKEKIDNTFGWNVFLKKITFLEDDESLIFEHDDRNTYSLTDKGVSILNTIKNELDFENKKQKIELDNLKTSTRVNKFLLKTKWAPLFLSFAAIFVSIYLSIQDKNKQEELEKKILENEKTIDTLKIQILNLQKKTVLLK